MDDLNKLASEIEGLSAARKADSIENIRKAEREFAACVSKNLPSIIAALREAGEMREALKHYAVRESGEIARFALDNALRTEQK